MPGRLWIPPSSRDTRAVVSARIMEFLQPVGPTEGHYFMGTGRGTEGAAPIQLSRGELDVRRRALKRNRKIHSGLVFALVLLLAWTNAAATDWTLMAEPDGPSMDAPSIGHSLDGDSEDAFAGSECAPPPSNRRPELPPIDLDNGVPSYVPALTIDLSSGVPQIRLGTSVIDVSSYLQPK
jgi:hypothetical protein